MIFNNEIIVIIKIMSNEKKFFFKNEIFKYKICLENDWVKIYFLYFFVFSCSDSHSFKELHIINLSILVLITTFDQIIN